MSREQTGNSLVVQWLGLHASTAGGMGSIPGQGTKILYATQHGQKKKKNKQINNKRVGTSPDIFAYLFLNRGIFQL